MARERRLEARQVEEIFLAFAEVMRELPPDIEAGLARCPRAICASPPISPANCGPRVEYGSYSSNCGKAKTKLDEPALAPIWVGDDPGRANVRYRS